MEISETERGLNTTAVLHTTQHDQPVEVLVLVDLLWYTTDPLAMRLTFHTEGSLPVTWVVALELIRDALLQLRPVGEGDIRVQQVNESTVYVELASPDGYALVELDRNDLVEFVTNVDAARPPWQAIAPESLDAWIEDTLATEGKQP